MSGTRTLEESQLKHTHEQGCHGRLVGEYQPSCMWCVEERGARRVTTREEALEAALRVAVREMERASNVGEVQFPTNALASGVRIGLDEALFTARAALVMPRSEGLVCTICGTASGKAAKRRAEEVESIAKETK